MVFDIIGVVMMRSSWLANALIALSLVPAFALVVWWACALFAADHWLVWNMASPSRESKIDLMIDRASVRVRYIHWLDSRLERQQFLQNPSQTLASIFELGRPSHPEFGVWNNVGLMWAGDMHFYLAFPVALVIPLLLFCPVIRLRQMLISRRTGPHAIC